MRFIKPLDEDLLHQVFKNYKTIITIEDGTIKGGFGSAVLEFAAHNNYKNSIKCLGIPDEFVEQGTIDELQKLTSLDAYNITTILESYS